MFVELSLYYFLRFATTAARLFTALSFAILALYSYNSVRDFPPCSTLFCCGDRAVIIESSSLVIKLVLLVSFTFAYFSLLS